MVRKLWTEFLEELDTEDQQAHSYDPDVSEPAEVDGLLPNEAGSAQLDGVKDRIDLDPGIDVGWNRAA